MTTLKARKKGVVYLFQLFTDANWSPRLAIADNHFSRQYNIYGFSIAPRIVDPTNYWIAWGGTFDNPNTLDVEVFLDNFLLQVYSEAALISATGTFYIDTVNSICYINIAYKPWQYRKSHAAVYSDTDNIFSSGPINDIYSNNVYNNQKVKPRLIPPDFKYKLNNVFAGIMTYQNFTVRMMNNDGLFDSIDMASNYNSICKLLKNNQDDNTYNLLRRGFVDDIKLNGSEISILAYDNIFNFSREVCDKLSIDLFPNLPEENYNKDIPLGWGSLLKAPVIEVDRDQETPCTWIDYYVLDPDYITAVSLVYADDGSHLAYTFDSATGIIRTTSVDGDGVAIDAVSANVTGSASNNLQEILLDILINIENLPYADTIWDTSEVDFYKTVAPTLNFYFAGGSTDTFIKNLFKNDTVYLFNKVDGLLTIRQWGQSYDEFTISNKLIMDTIDKSFSDAKKFFMSSAKINYDFDLSTKNPTKNYLYDDEEDTIFLNYKKERRGNFDVQIDNQADVILFAQRLINRFGTMRETIKVKLGCDTNQINMLDTINLTVDVNGRIMSQYTQWIAKSVNPAQDTPELEAV